jgi:hypothetical protein
MGGKLIGLIRVSTGQQGDSGLGLEAQEAAITAYAARTGYGPATIRFPGQRQLNFPAPDPGRLSHFGSHETGAKGWSPIACSGGCGS